MVQVESLSTTEKDFKFEVAIGIRDYNGIDDLVWYGVVATSISFGARAIELRIPALLLSYPGNHFIFLSLGPCLKTGGIVMLLMSQD